MDRDKITSHIGNRVVIILKNGRELIGILPEFEKDTITLVVNSKFVEIDCSYIGALYDKEDNEVDIKN